MTRPSVTSSSLLNRVIVSGCWKRVTDPAGRSCRLALNGLTRKGGDPISFDNNKLNVSGSSSRAHRIRFGLSASDAYRGAATQSASSIYVVNTRPGHSRLFFSARTPALPPLSLPNRYARLDTPLSVPSIVMSYFSTPFMDLQVNAAGQRGENETIFLVYKTSGCNTREL